MSLSTYLLFSIGWEPLKFMGVKISAHIGQEPFGHILRHNSSDDGHTGTVDSFDIGWGYTSIANVGEVQLRDNLRSPIKI